MLKIVAKCEIIISGEKMLEVNHLNYSVVEDGKNIDILKDVNLKIEDNELVVITGQNGSGKSTLAKILMGIIPATSGQILLNGKDITNMSITDRARLGIAYAFQQPTVFKGLTVKDLIDIATGDTNTVASACDYLSRVGLCAKEYINREVNSKLSGGELKRIELALLLARGAELNICDEPEAGIDLWSFDALVQLFQSEKRTFVVISHQRKLIEIASKVVLMESGQIKKIGTFAQVSGCLQPLTCDKLEGK
ncbi:MAG: ABC transporter ATP-binding protein [Christensenellales bacterium]